VLGTPFDANIPELERVARRAMVGQAVWLGLAEAEVLCRQFQETATFRGWKLFAVAIMRNHVHVVVGVPGDPEPERLLQDFKSYGSRTLSEQGWKPAGARWWTRSGSKRKLPSYEAVCAASDYVTRQQLEPLIVWSSCDPRM
jgi:REP element-mobilizing transposase RayT